MVLQSWSYEPAKEQGSYPMQNLCLAVITGGPLLAALFTGLRLYAKRRSGWGWDDVTIVLATIFSIIIIYPSWRWTIMWHFGIHIWDVDHKHIEPSMHEYYQVSMAFNMFSAFILPLVKASILLLLLKVGGVLAQLRKWVWALFIFNAGCALFPAAFLLFECPPKTGNTWAPRTFGGAHCLGRLAVGRLNIFQVTSSMLTDLLIFPIPVYLTWKLQKASLRSRLIVVFLFSLSLGVTAIGAARIYLTYLDRLYAKAPDDWTWSINFCINHAENTVAIVVACIPSLRVLILRWLGASDEERTSALIREVNQTPSDPEHHGVVSTKKSSSANSNKYRKKGLYDTTIDMETVKASDEIYLTTNETHTSSKTAFCSRSDSIVSN